MAIEDYSVLTDGRSTALVGRDLAIDWWPLPTLDSPPVFAALIDPDHGGYLTLTPVGVNNTTRRYLPGTNVIETTITTATGTITVTDALNVGTGGRLPWSELARRIDGIQGHVDLHWHVRPGTRFGSAKPATTTWDGQPVLHLEDQQLAVITTSPWHLDDRGVGGQVQVVGGERCLFALVGVDNEPLVFPDIDAVDARIDRTIDHWQRWSDQLEYTGPFRAEVERAALALKTLIFEPAGAIAAAATTSLPERRGGPKNWDYRYAWVRDSSFALDALISLGLHEEVHRAVSWLLAALKRTAPDLHVFYTLEGTAPGREQRLDAAGYRNSRPVRSGNGASTQTQLGCYGDLFDTIHRYSQLGHLLDPATTSLLAGYADRCLESWRNPDSGMWELADLQHYTISKIGCWVALDRAARLAAAGQLPDDHGARWRAGAAAIKRWVGEHCWSTTKQSYTFYAGTDRLDAAVLLAGRTGFDRGQRLESTCQAVASELGVPGTSLLYRYSGASEEEGAFVACTFWLAQALSHLGHTVTATEIMAQAVTYANDVGLLSEEIDPTSGTFLGNVPQALSHLALINAATNLQLTDQAS